jgi:protein-tyrosine kinase
LSVVEKAMSKLRSPAVEAAEPGSLRPSTVTPARLPTASAAANPARVVSMNRARLQAAGLSPEPGEERRLADQYRRIKRPILDRILALTAARAPGAQLVMMASALPGDGKTFSSINLALSIARERDVSVLLVDADVAKPHVSRIFGLEHEPGLLDVLADESLDVESFVLPTDIPGLNILPAGRQQEAATELLASTRMMAITARLSGWDPCRVVLFDSPPLLLSSESRAVAQIVGQVVLMVRAGSTPRGAVLEAIAHAGADKLTGLVLNQSEMSSSGKHYGYGSYGDDTNASAT